MKIQIFLLNFDKFLKYDLVFSSKYFLTNNKPLIN